jgi:hypothetical protein
MKTVLIIVSLVCTDYAQKTYCYKAVVESTRQGVTKMKPAEKACDTFTVFTSTPYSLGDKVPILY